MIVSHKRYPPQTRKNTRIPRVSHGRSAQPRSARLTAVVISDDVAVFGAFAVGDDGLAAAGRPSGGVTERGGVAGDHGVVTPTRRAVDVRQVDVLDGGLDGGRTGPGERATAEQVPVEVFAEHAADEV